QKLWIQSEIQEAVGKKVPLYFIDHHLSHAASAFLVSPFEEAGILTFDGVGEWTTTAQGYGKGTDVVLTKEIKYPHSLGLLYSTFTSHAGFEVNEGEYKLMGLAGYGQPTYYQQVRDLIDIRDDGSFQLDMSYFAYHYSLHSMSEKFLQVFGPARSPESPMEDRYANIAASIQQVVEEVMLTAARHVRQSTGTDYLCMAGGVALNGVANGRILREAGFKDIWIQPAAGDAGGALGVATYLYHKISGQPRSFVMRNVYLGPAYSNDEIKAFLQSNAVEYQELDDTALVETVGRLLAEDNVVGWFQGRMEFGPRALGSRSILANASHPQMKDILNEKIKHREQFRPFAPAVLLEEAPNYFALDPQHASPFMVLVCDVQPQYRELLPAITHVDGTARIQTVTAEENGLYYQVIREFYRHTQVPVIVNTSFNVRGEPIVCTPAEAYNCFSHTDMDYLVMGNCVVTSAAKKILAAYPGRKGPRVKEEVIV
ncbi:MAG TPA: carbamoyltransferase C-terminal domain-containing protein, partial [Chloroflexia bacterium]|nr:carbamoyltransferase C-terminal domain-containing protein [Chloroflexia bacterium]